MEELKASEIGVIAIVLLFVIKELIGLIKWLMSKKDDQKKPEQPVMVCNAESKDVLDMKLKRHEKMIETLETMKTTLTIMNESVQSTNAKAARVEEKVILIHQTVDKL